MLMYKGGRKVGVGQRVSVDPSQPLLGPSHTEHPSRILRRDILSVRQTGTNVSCVTSVGGYPVPSPHLSPHLPSQHFSFIQHLRTLPSMASSFSILY